eukprot:g55769.t1
MGQTALRRHRDVHPAPSSFSSPVPPPLECGEGDQYRPDSTTVIAFAAAFQPSQTRQSVLSLLRAIVRSQPFSLPDYSYLLLTREQACALRLALEHHLSSEFCQESLLFLDAVARYGQCFRVPEVWAAGAKCALASALPQLPKDLQSIIQDYATPLVEAEESARRIWRTFLDNNSAWQVPAPATSRRKVHDRMEKADFGSDLFEELQEEMFFLLLDPFTRLSFRMLEDVHVGGKIDQQRPRRTKKKKPKCFFLTLF